MKFDAGADFRIRQEIMANLPGLPGDAYSQTPTVRAKSRNQIRMRPRVYFSAETGPFTLYARIADEFRHYPTLDVPRHSRAYYFPDEVFLDNLYIEGKGLEWNALYALATCASAPREAEAALSTASTCQTQMTSTNGAVDSYTLRPLSTAHSPSNSTLSSSAPNPIRQKAPHRGIARPAKYHASDYGPSLNSPTSGAPSSRRHDSSDAS